MGVKEEKIIFIDRDGVINEDPIGDYIKRWEDFRLMTGVISALKQFVDQGYSIVIISNQAGIGDGQFSKEALDKITEKMLALLLEQDIKIRAVYYCLHGKKANCDCRKPKTGLFERAAQDILFDRAKTYFIGDKATDIEAGIRFGLRTVFVLTGHGSNDRSKLVADRVPEHIAPSIAEAAQYVLDRNRL